MNNETHNNQDAKGEETQPEYDFSGGVRGKHIERFLKGYTVRVQKTDGTVEEQSFSPVPRVVVLDEDVFAYFSDSEAVNRALRALIEIVPQKKSA
jgi:hypothetical protein